MKKKIIKIVLGSSTGIVVMFIILLVPILMIYNFFGGEISNSGYIEGNIEYADMYSKVLNKYITQKNIGYIPLSRILYFYQEDDSLSFDEIYDKNLDKDLMTLKPISDVCLENFKNMSICSEEEISNSTQIDDYTYKPFSEPIDFLDSTITSYFAQERIVYDEFEIHYAWDFGSKEKSPVYSVYDGEVIEVRFNQTTNEINKSNGAGNYITIRYEIEDDIYDVLYGHLYPFSNRVNIGDKVNQGDVIALVGTTGYSTGNHLHWQVLKNGNKIDGMNLVDFTLKI